MPVKLAPRASEIRFRITHGADPHGFSGGRDLTLPNGLPWSLPLLTLSPPLSPAILDMLFHNGLLDKANLDWLSQREGNWIRSSKPRLFIHCLDQVFMHDFSRYHIFCNVVGETTVSKGIFLSTPFAYQTSKDRWVRPFSGRALMRLEEHEKTLALRIVKLLTPVQCTPAYDGYLPIPTEGELVYVRQRGTGLRGVQRALKPWTISQKKLAKHEALLELMRRASSRRLEQQELSPLSL
ncbi:hypothetical protein HWV62_29402 [Athelia sp. TMB]|nr:hypothetical protein HWV62_29402 [Athelia sp. TMB]